jgi:hypothetical protein
MTSAKRIGKKAAPNTNRREAPEVAETTFFPPKGCERLLVCRVRKKSLLLALLPLTRQGSHELSKQTLALMMGCTVS